MHRLGLALMAGLSLALSILGSAGAGGTALPAVKPAQSLAVLLTSHPALIAPVRGAARLRTVAPRRPLTGERTVLPIVERRTLRNGTTWLRVALPGRPNGRLGWIEQRGTRAGTTRWHLVVETASRRVRVFRAGRLVRSFRAIVGKESTPTPSGAFFVEEAIQLARTDAGAPFALALSARSNVLQEFAGGPGQIAFHGLLNVGGTLGTAVSHGCVRLANDAMRWLVLRIGPGVPVTIVS